MVDLCLNYPEMCYDYNNGVCRRDLKRSASSLIIVKGALVSENGLGAKPPPRPWRNFY